VVETTVSRMGGFWLQMAARKHPDRVAVESGELAITYEQLSQASIDGARGLGTETGPVALEIDDPFDFSLALHTCLLNGSPAVPIDLRLSEEERAVRRRGAEAVLTSWPPVPQASRAWRAVSASGSSEDVVATVMHTSGTTSEPKRVELTYGNWMANAQGSAAALGVDPDERWLCAMPLTHVGGLSILIRSLIYATTAVLHRGFDTEAVLAELMSPERRITMVSLVPTMLARLLDAGLTRPPTLRWALVGGGPIDPSLLQRAARAGVAVAPTYGMTETCSQAFTFGLPLHGVDAITSKGELLVRGPMVAPGSLSDDGWLHTGDLAEFDGDGLRIVGRKSNTIITGGENVAPEEVEAVLLSHPDVADAAVVGRADPEWGEAVVGLVVLRNGGALDAEAMRSFCRERLAGFKVPKALEIVDGLPRTSSGKLLRRELR
jgi:o-succinylbenzoate---CoA ligase